MFRKIFIQVSVVAIIILQLSGNLFAGDLKIIHEKTFQTELGKEFKLETNSGDVYISTWDKPEVYVKISGNRKAESKMKFRFEKTDDGIIIKGKRDSWFSWFSWGGVYVKYEIKLPSMYNAEVSTAGGDIKLYDLNGSIDFHTSGGDVFLKNVEGTISTTTSGGEIVIEDNKGKTNASTSGGDIHMKNFNGDISVSTSGGDIILNGNTGKIDASTSGGDIELTYFGINKGIELSTTGGDINVKVPNNFAADADLSTTGGDVSCNLPITSKGKFSSSHLSGRLNGGGPILECTTTGGNIKVED